MAPRATFTIAGIPGSLRGDSFNRRLLETVAYELPPGTTLEIWDGLEHVSPFNEAHVFPAVRRRRPAGPPRAEQPAHRPARRSDPPRRSRAGPGVTSSCCMRSNVP